VQRGIRADGKIVDDTEHDIKQGGLS